MKCENSCVKIEKRELERKEREILSHLYTPGQSQLEVGVNVELLIS